MKKRIMVIGPNNSGKSELISYLEGEVLNIIKDSIFYKKETIYVPSSYIEYPSMYKHILSVQQQAYLVVMMLSENKTKRTYPPNFAYQFKMPVIGLIVVNHGKNQNKDMIEECEKELETTGVSQQFIVDFQCKTTLETFDKYLATQNYKKKEVRK